jgi:hypothetical protein
MTQRLTGAAIVAALVAGMLAPAAALAKEGDVIKTGACSAASTWKLKLSPEDPGMIEVVYEVDENVSGHVWKVRVRQNGDLVFKGKLTTRDPSGSLRLRRVYPDTSGRDVFTARAINQVTGETCWGRAVLPG